MRQSHKIEHILKQTYMSGKIKRNAEKNVCSSDLIWSLRKSWHKPAKCIFQYKMFYFFRVLLQNVLIQTVTIHNVWRRQLVQMELTLATAAE